LPVLGIALVLAMSGLYLARLLPSADPAATDPHRGVLGRVRTRWAVTGQ
jgi:hypothetical protein